jgi:galactokinase
MAKIDSLIEKISGGKNLLFNELYGTEEKVLKEQADRYTKLLGDFQKTYGKDDVLLFSSPRANRNRRKSYRP